jgi:FkbM family methyltransferase
MVEVINFPYEDNISIEIPIECNKDSIKMMKFISTNEPHLRQIHSILIKNNLISTIVDVGAYIGDNSLPWSRMLLDSKVYCIEPSKNNHEFINNICIKNNINNIVFIEKAISDKEEIINTNYDNIDHCSFVWENGHVGKPHNNREIKHSVEATTIDTLVHAGTINNFDCIHIDVEGMEYKVLNGSINSIKRYNPVITFEGHITTEPNEISKNKDLLTNLNYDIYMINDVIKPGQCHSDCRNFIAFPSSEKFTNIKNKINTHFNKTILM